MDWLNHWIPRRPVPGAALPPTSCRRAFAGMTTGRWSGLPSFYGQVGCGWEFVGDGKRAVRMPTNSFLPRRHSGAGRNPVVLIIHSRGAGMTTRHDDRRRHPAKPAIHSPLWHPLLGGCSRRRSTTYIPVGVDSGLRRAAAGSPGRVGLYRFSRRSRRAPVQASRYSGRAGALRGYARLTWMTASAAR